MSGITTLKIDPLCSTTTMARAATAKAVPTRHNRIHMLNKQTLMHLPSHPAARTGDHSRINTRAIHLSRTILRRHTVRPPLLCDIDDRK